MARKLCEHILKKKVKLMFDDKNKTTLCPICKRLLLISDVPKEFKGKKYESEWVDYFTLKSRR